jgi:hypothetical protein
MDIAELLSKSDLNPSNWAEWVKPDLPDFDFDSDGNKIAFEKNCFLRPEHLEFDLTPEHILENLRCSLSPQYFTYHYAKVLGDEGYVFFQMSGREYQKKILDMVHRYPRVIAMMPRQSGKTVIIAAYMAWMVMFHRNKYILMCTHKRNMAKKHLNERIKPIISQTPKWMQPGIVMWGKEELHLANGSHISIDSTTGDSGAGSAIDMLYLDEFALVKTHLAQDFIASVMPVVSGRASSRIIITSTPRGMNHFYKMYKDKNRFISFGPDQEEEERRMDWTDVPRKSVTVICTFVNKNDPKDIITREYREDREEEPEKYIVIKNKCYEVDRGLDKRRITHLTPEEFKAMEMPTVGEMKWYREYECKFLGSANTLIKGEKLSVMTADTPIQETHGGNLKVYERPTLGRIYICGVDISQGLGCDYTAISVIDVSKLPYKQVATYRSNTVRVNAVASILKDLGHLYNDAMMIIENNGPGLYVAQDLWENFEYDNIFKWHPQKGTKVQDFGIRTTPQTKTKGCNALKDLIESDKLFINDKETIQELMTFISNGRSWSAEDGDDNHDDTVMANVMAALFITLDEFQDFIKSPMNFARDVLGDDLKKIHSEMGDLYMFDDGTKDYMRQMDLNQVVSNTLNCDDNWLWE